MLILGLGRAAYRIWGWRGGGGGGIDLPKILGGGGATQYGSVNVQSPGREGYAWDFFQGARRDRSVVLWRFVLLVREV